MPSFSFSDGDERWSYRESGGALMNHGLRSIQAARIFVDAWTAGLRERNEARLLRALNILSRVDRLPPHAQIRPKSPTARVGSRPVYSFSVRAQS